MSCASSDYRTVSYTELCERSSRLAVEILDGVSDLGEAPVAYACPSHPRTVIAQWAIWRAGGIAVPLAPSHPPRELAYTLADSGARIVLCDRALRDRLPQAEIDPTVRLIDVDGSPAAGSAVPSPPGLPDVVESRGALLLYTSGTTHHPKGVLITHANVAAQIASLVDAWGWREDDHILSFLPLHHVHGLVNVVSCALWSGARITFMPAFDAARVWEHVASSELTLFMAVPTIYHRLATTWDELPADVRDAARRGCERMRLMVSGSAALPVSLLERWRRITGHVLLERYGMTEIGMALSNPLEGPRVPGYVGRPLPGVSVRLVDDRGDDVPDDEPGEIRVKGPTVFERYWRRPDATGDAFDGDWFRTGDVAVRDAVGYRILGRRDVDIIKTGGYKVSALEIESVLLEHPRVGECAVVGIPDAEWGEVVAAAIVVRSPSTDTDDEIVDADALRAWAKTRLAAYKVPARLVVVSDLPRNALGKVQKPRLASQMRGTGSVT